MQHRQIQLLQSTYSSLSYGGYVEYGDLRISGGGDYGRLEFRWYNNTWGGVCDNGFHYEEARVACRQLGYDNGNLFFNISR